MFRIAELSEKVSDPARRGKKQNETNHRILTSFIGETRNFERRMFRGQYPLGSVELQGLMTLA